MKRALPFGVVVASLAAGCLEFNDLASSFCTKFPTSPACADAGPDAGDPDAGNCALSCDGGCVDPTIDQENCGGCGLSCGGGACTAGVCGAATLAASLQEPRYVQARGGIAYFASAPGSAVFQWAPDGGLNVISGQAFPQARAVVLGAVGRVHFAADMPVDGGTIFAYFESTNSVQVVTYGANIAEMHFRGGLIFWADPVNVNLPLWKVSADGTGRLAFSGANAGNTSDVRGLSADDGYFYWAEQRASGVVRRMSAASCCTSIATMADFQASPTRPFFWDGGVWWTKTLDDGGIGQSLLPAGSAVTDVVDHQPNAAFLYVDEGGIYWANLGFSEGDGGYVYGTGSVMKRTWSGTVSALATNQNEIGGLAVDGPFLYWTVVAPPGAGTLMRIRR